MLLKLVNPIHPKGQRWLADCGACGAVSLDPTQTTQAHVICPACRTEQLFQIVPEGLFGGLLGGSYSLPKDVYR